MKNVLWFIADDNENIVEQVTLPENAEEQAIAEFTVRMKAKGIDGRFKLGYITTDGEKYVNSECQIFGNPEQLKDDDYEKNENVDF